MSTKLTETEAAGNIWHYLRDTGDEHIDESFGARKVDIEHWRYAVKAVEIHTWSGIHDVFKSFGDRIRSNTLG